jgi:hypothetical protein
MRRGRRALGLFYAGCSFFLLVIVGFSIGPVLNGMREAARDAVMQQGRQIGQCLFAYATDNVANGNAYPDEKSSTEIFQTLIDKGYATDPSIFYVPMPGKVRPVPGQKLKPENVSWDVTVPVDVHSSDLLPLVFLTGYKVNYVPGGTAMPLVTPAPQYGGGISMGEIVFYKGNNMTYRPNASAADGSIPNFVPPEFKPDGKTYRQLTPDGLLP